MFCLRNLQNGEQQQDRQNENDDHCSTKNFLGGDLRFSRFKHSAGNTGIGQGTHQFRHRLHPLGRVEPHRAGKDLSKIGGNTGLQAVSGFQTVTHLTLRGRNRCLPCDKPIRHGREGIDIGVPAGKFCRRILFRRSITGVQLTFQFTAAGSQCQGSVSCQDGGSINGKQNVIRADSAMNQAGFVQQGHAFHHRLQQGTCLCRGQGTRFQ